MKENYYILLINGRYDSLHTNYDSLNEYLENYSPDNVEIIQFSYESCIELLKDLIQKINVSDFWSVYHSYFEDYVCP